MDKWSILLVPVSGRTGQMRVEADTIEVVQGHLLLKAGEKTVAAVAPGAWVSLERLDT